MQQVEKCRILQVSKLDEGLKILAYPQLEIILTLDFIENMLV
jgi:hypothetical protein